jgi:hypothetical protein
LYVSKWLKELRAQQEADKDLAKYDLSVVFTQSVESFKLLFDHSRVLTKLPVRDLIASGCDYLQEQVISEQKSSNARKQQGIEVPSKSTVPPVKKEEHKGFTAGHGPMSYKQARAFMTEAASAMTKQDQRGPPSGGAARAAQSFQGPAGPRDGLVAFAKLSFHDVGCDGCGKWYKNNPGSRYPNPCSGRCQYEGHPLQNTRFQQGVKWKHHGLCLSWKGVQDKDIPPATLARLQKYTAVKRDREHPL